MADTKRAAEMIEHKPGRLPSASVSFLGARANKLIDQGGREPRGGSDSSGDVPDGLRPTSVPQSTGEPELRRRTP